jgi:transposase-like protein
MKRNRFRVRLTTSQRKPEVDMLSSDAWRKQVVSEGVALCRSCGSTHLSMGSCAIGAMTVHQEYVCEDCGHEFTALYSLAGCYDGIGDPDA